MGENPTETKGIFCERDRERLERPRMESEVDKYVRRVIKFPFCNVFKEDDSQIRIIVENSSYHTSVQLLKAIRQPMIHLKLMKFPFFITPKSPLIID